MEKFNNIKVGDKVFIRQDVKFGWNSAKSFFVKVEVLKVTKTQFTVEGDYRFRKNGSGLGDMKYRTAYNIGEKAGFPEREITDERKEMNEFRKVIESEIKIRNEFSDLSIELGSGLTKEECDVILSKISDIKALLKS